MSHPNQPNAINPAIARITDNRCFAFTKTGNPCRNHKKIGGDYCGKHDSEEKRPEAKHNVQGNRALLNANINANINSNRIEEKRIEEKKVVYPEDDYHGRRCTTINRNGTRCKEFGHPRLCNLCTRHYNRVRARQALALARAEEKEDPEDDVFSREVDSMVSILQQVSFEEYEYRQPIVQPPHSRMGVPFPRAGAGAMGYKTNMKTLRECECDICAEDKKRMIVLHCCRKEMCADCMIRITNAKCPFCKQDNNMIIE